MQQRFFSFVRDRCFARFSNDEEIVMKKSEDAEKEEDVVQRSARAPLFLDYRSAVGGNNRKKPLRTRVPRSRIDYEDASAIADSIAASYFLGRGEEPSSRRHT